MPGVWRRGCVPVGALSRKYRILLQELQIVSLDHAWAVVERADADPHGGHGTAAGHELWRRVASALGWPDVQPGEERPR
jgi:hypothetical protein